jgi:hypothetical protein
MRITLKDIANSRCAHLNQHLFQNPSSQAKKKSKYGNKKTEVDGITFDSEKEAKRYGELKIMQKAGLIGLLQMQVEYRLEVNGEKVASYIADFVYLDSQTGQTVVEDVKSEMTRKLPVYRLKKKLMKQIHNIEIAEV